MSVAKIHELIRRAERYGLPREERESTEYAVESLVRPRNELALTPEELAKASLTPRCIVDKYLYADVAEITAPGGVGKTTALLHEAICIVLGRDVWGMPVVSPGWVLIVTKEDQREIIAGRLREIMHAMSLTEGERQKVLAGVIPLDVTGTPTKLTYLHDGNILWAPFANCVIETYKNDPPAVIIFDPLVSFGADEGKVNENEQALVEVARSIVRALNCCVRYVHHTGKVNAREGTTDQYTGRGGSALPDGCRMVTVLAQWDGKSNLPEGCVAGEGVGIFRLERPKLSYAPPGLPTIWIRRDGFRYDHFLEYPMSPEEVAAAHVEQLERFLEQCVSRNPPEFHTQTTLEGQTSSLKMSRAEIRAALGNLFARGRVVEVPLPTTLRRGGRKHFICPTDRAEQFGGLEP